MLYNIIIVLHKYPPPATLAALVCEKLGSCRRDSYKPTSSSPVSSQLLPIVSKKQHSLLLSCTLLTEKLL